MGKPVKILDLAKNMINLSGLTVKDSDSPDGDIEIELVPKRPGEKLYEELLVDDKALKTDHPKVYLSVEKSCSEFEIENILTDINKFIQNNSIKELTDLLAKNTNAKFD